MTTPRQSTATPRPGLPRNTPGRRLRSMRTALVVATLCAITLLWLIDHSFRQLGNIDVERQEIETVRATIEALTNDLTLAESSQRGFLLTGNQAELAVFDQTVQRVTHGLKRLDLEHTQPSTTPFATGPFRQALDDGMAQLRATADLYRNGQIVAARQTASSAEAEARMQAIRDQGSQLMTQADALLAQHRRDAGRLINYSRLAFLACILAALLGFALYMQQRERLRLADLQRQRLLETERDRLETKVRERTRELGELATHLQQAVERERERLARELHDELGALMTAAKFDVARMRARLPADANELQERLNHLKRTLNDAIALKRRIMEDLYPSALHNLGLIPALDFLAREFSIHSNIRVNTHLQPVTLDPDAQLTVYRLIQEALTNIGKHAQASQADIHVTQEGRAVRILVRDDGRGFDTGSARPGTHGLAGMRHRLQSCGGQLHIASATGQGTRITARIDPARDTTTG